MIPGALSMDRVDPAGGALYKSRHLPIESVASMERLVVEQEAKPLVLTPADPVWQPGPIPILLNRYLALQAERTKQRRHGGQSWYGADELDKMIEALGQKIREMLTGAPQP